MISYAQNLEDVMLARVFSGRTSGSYVDLGAMDPEFHSVTKHFYDSGWTGINIEPNPFFYRKLIEQRPRDINLNCGIGSALEIRRFLAFYTEGLSSFHVEAGTGASLYEHTILEVPVLPLRCIIDMHPEAPQFLKIDVEGWEAEVLQTADFTKYRPEVIVVEAVDMTARQPNFESWEHILLVQGYEFVYFDGINRFYVRSESPDLKRAFAVPVNTLDGYQPAELYRLRERPESAGEQSLADSVDNREQRISVALSHQSDEANRLRDVNARLGERLRQQEAELELLRASLRSERELNSEREQALKEAQEQLGRCRCAAFDGNSKEMQTENGGGICQPISLVEAQAREIAEIRAAHVEDRLWLGQISQLRAQEADELARSKDELAVLRERCAFHVRHSARLEGLLNSHAIKY